MAENKNNTQATEEEVTITLEFEDGVTTECEIMGIFDVDGKDYIALIPDDGSDDVWIYAYKELDEEGSFDIEDIADEALFNKVAQEFDAIMAEDAE